MNRGTKQHNQKLSPTPFGLAGIVNGKTKYPKGEIFYSIQDGDWSDTNTWQTVSGRSGKTPSQYDDVFIRHTVVINLTVAINSLYVSGTLTYITIPNFTIEVNHLVVRIGGKIVMTGTTVYTNLLVIKESINNNGDILVDVNFPSYSITKGIRFNGNVFLKNLGNVNNTPFSFINSTMELPGGVYHSFTNQNNSGIISLIGNVIFTQYLRVGFSVLDCANFDLECLGDAFIFQLRKLSPGKITIHGSVQGPAITSVAGVVLEIKGDIDHVNHVSMPAGTMMLSTNNKTWNNTYYASNVFYCDVLVSGAIIVQTTGNKDINLSGTLNGDDAASEFKNGQYFSYRNAQQPMIVGVLNCNSSPNTFVYNRNGNQEVKGTTYHILEFGGSGVKKLMGNVIVDVTSGGSWSITGTATIDYNGFTITTI